MVERAGKMDGFVERQDDNRDIYFFIYWRMNQSLPSVFKQFGSSHFRTCRIRYLETEPKPTEFNAQAQSDASVQVTTGQTQFFNRDPLKAS